MEQTASTLMAMIQSGKGGCAHLLAACKSYHLSFGIKPGDFSFQELFTKFHFPQIVMLNFGSHAKDEGDVHAVWSNIAPTLTDIIQKITR